MARGVYGAFNRHTGECVYIGKSNSSIQGRWTQHKKHWKIGKPIHRQQLFTQYLYYFGDQIEWKILQDVTDPITADWTYGDEALLAYLEREIFFKCKPIANAYIPNGWDTLRLAENTGQPYPISEWNPYSVFIRITKGQFLKFEDDVAHFTNPRVIGSAERASLTNPFA